MSETELLHAMCEAYWKAAPGITNSMRNILELLHAHGYRRCAEGQRTTQYCSAWEQADKACRDLTEKVIPNLRERADRAEAEVERLRAVLAASKDLLANSDEYRLDDGWGSAAKAEYWDALDDAIGAARGES